MTRPQGVNVQMGQWEARAHFFQNAQPIGPRRHFLTEYNPLFLAQHEEGRLRVKFLSSILTQHYEF